MVGINDLQWQQPPNNWAVQGPDSHATIEGMAAKEVGREQQWEKKRMKTMCGHILAEQVHKVGWPPLSVQHAK